MTSKKKISKDIKKKEKPTLKTATKEAKIGTAEKAKKITAPKKGADGKWDKAFMSDSKAVDYVCPNNRKNRLQGDGHFFRHQCSETYSKKKIPKCPYCDTLTVMIDYDQEKKDVEKDKKVP
jgi:hypothetical protein